MSVQDLARTLVAAGSIRSPDADEEGIYLLNVSDSNLVEKLWVGDGAKSELVIASDAKANTTAAYLLDAAQDIRLVVFIDQSHTVQCYAYNDEIEEWEKTGLGEKWNITAHPQSKLSATFGPKGDIVVCYQDTAGRLAGVMSVAEGEWKKLGPLKADPVTGTPICLDVIDDKLHLFYASKDSSVRYLVLNSATNDWQVNLLPNTKFETPIDNFSVAKNPDTGFFQSYFLTAGSLWNVNGDKEKTRLGKVERNGKLIPADNAQAGWRVYWRGARYVEATPYRVRICVLELLEPSRAGGSNACRGAPQVLLIVLPQVSLTFLHIYETDWTSRRQTHQYLHKMSFDSLGIDLKDFNLPSQYFNQTQRGDGPPKTDRYGIDLKTPPRRWEDWIVKLEFEKLGQGKHGNGFFVNIPINTFDVIFTAGHNLVDAPQHYCGNIRIITPTGEIPVTPEMTRVHKRYFDEPDEMNAIYDYGIILLRRPGGHRDPRRGFGFSLMLGLSPPLRGDAAPKGEEEKDMVQDRNLYVSGYRPVVQDSPGKGPPRRSDGKCVLAGTHQLIYKAKTEEGISGGPVWLGFRGVETVVAIHNYGKATIGKGNRGSRLNLDFWRTVFGWLDIYYSDKSLHHKATAPYSMHLHIPSDVTPASRKAPAEGRVRVGQPGRIESRFDVLPVSSQPGDRVRDACWSFLLSEARSSTGAGSASTSSSPLRWVRWDVYKQRVQLTDRYDARCEVMIINLILQPNKPFEIQARLDQDTWLQVQMTMALVDPGDLELLADDPQSVEDTSEISFGVSANKLFTFQ
ncbi:hypothetical protein BGZ63DRAFT_462195 [Mariannaea sp. PMI_226]|nr:hypothetical protein BGZ63DRAFT_462195 [Mariannaea sp. PMI_226]